MTGHAHIERQVAALHAAIAAMIEAGDPQPLQRAADNLARWRDRFDGQLPRAYAEWQEVLDVGDVGRVLSILRSADEDAVRRRSSSPFTGILRASERLQIMRNAA